MSTATMVMEGPEVQKEEFPKKEGISSAGGKKSRKEMIKEAIAKRAELAGKKYQPQAKKPPEIAPESEQAEVLINMLKTAADKDEMRELLDSFQEYVKPATIEKALTELTSERQESLLGALEGLAKPEDLEKYKSLTAPTREKVEDKAIPGHEEKLPKPEEAVPVSEVPIVEPKESSVAGVAEVITPEKEVSVIESSAPTLPKFNTLEELEEAFGRGDIDQKKFLQEKTLLRPSIAIKEDITKAESPTAQTSSGVDYYEFLKSYVEGRAQRRQIEAEEQGLQGRLRRRPKQHPARRAQEEKEESRISTAPEFPPTEEMERISTEITNVTDQAYAAWQRVAAYKLLNARTLQKMEELRGFFLKLQRLHNQLEEAKVRARIAFEQKEEARKKSHGPTATGSVKQSPSFGISIGKELESKGVPVFKGERGKEVLTPKELHQFLQERKVLEKQSKLERQQEKRVKKDALRIRQRAGELAGEYLEKAEEAFGRGELKQEEFVAKRDFAKGFGKGGNIIETLDIGLGQGVLSQEEYLKLKLALVEKSAFADNTKKETLEALEEAFGRGEIDQEEFLRRKQKLH